MFFAQVKVRTTNNYGGKTSPDEKTMVENHF